MKKHGDCESAGVIFAFGGGDFVAQCVVAVFGLNQFLQAALGIVLVLRVGESLGERAVKPEHHAARGGEIAVEIDLSEEIDRIVCPCRVEQICSDHHVVLDGLGLDAQLEQRTGVAFCVVGSLVEKAVRQDVGDRPDSGIMSAIKIVEIDIECFARPEPDADAVRRNLFVTTRLLIRVGVVYVKAPLFDLEQTADELIQLLTRRDNCVIRLYCLAAACVTRQIVK